MLPEFPKARKKMLEMWNEAFFAGFHGSDPMLSEIPLRVQKEGNKAFIGGGEMEYKKCSASTSFQAKHAEGMSGQEFLGSAANLGTELAKAQAKGVFSAISDPFSGWQPVICDGPLTFQAILATLEKMDVDFAADGSPRWPAIVLNPPAHAEFKEKLPKWLADPECKLRFDDLIERKRKDFNEREARRRLVD